MSDIAKKLTVSFGAFSCTLSGFDDPFPVMRQVVDYFQQLAQRDPAFGAHPERPDTEILRALAEQSTGVAVDAQMNGDEVVLTSSEEQIVATASETPVALDVAPMVLDTAERAPLFAEEDTFDEIAAEDIDFAVTPKMREETVESTTVEAEETNTAETLSETEIASEEPAHIARDGSDGIDASEGEDAPEDTVADDLSTMIDAFGGETDDAPEFAEDPAPFVGEEADIMSGTETEDTPSVDLPTWASELVSDEPIIPTTAENRTEDQSVEEETVLFDDMQEEDLDAEDAALENLLNATNDTEELDRSNPLSQLRDDFLSAYDEETQEDAAEEREIPTVSEDAPEIERYDDTGEYADTGEQEDEYLHDATPEFDTEELNHALEPLRLGFGDMAGLDATKEVSTTTIDNRTKPDAAEVLQEIGLYSGEDEEGFDWDDIRAAVPSAFEPKEPETAEDANVTDEPAPLLLTPQLKVDAPDTTAEQDDAAEFGPIDMEQDDPRDDLRQFAQSTGAASLPELLEASAAFVTLVNGRPSFSRGEILGLLDEFSEEDGFSQEARIKSFGKLLRSGRIQRAQNGEYEITGAALSHYEDRAAS